MSKIIQFTQKGDFSSTKNFLKKMKERRFYNGLEKYAQRGVELLSKATPRRTGATAGAWYYRIIKTEQKIRIEWCNSNVTPKSNRPIALLIQTGHGTRNGGYVQPVDYINPVMKPLVDEITHYVERMVSSS